MGKRFWITYPDDETLEDAAGWTEAGPGRYHAVRNHLLVEVDDKTEVAGPAVSRMDWPADAEFSVQRKKSLVTTSVDEVQDSVAATVTSKMSREFAASVTSGAKFGATGAALSLASNLSEKTVDELTNTLGATLASKRTYSTEQLDEIVESLLSKVPKPDATAGTTTKVSIYFNFRRIVWKVFLVRTESLSLEYRRNWLWRRIRTTLDENVEHPRRPLYAVVMYEPTGGPSYAFGTFEPQIADGSRIRAQALDASCPGATPPGSTPLAALAKLAFPIGGGEKAEKERRVAAKKAAASARPRRPAAKKAAAKKAAKRPAARKAAMKRAPARKAAAKKFAARAPAAKRAPAKKPAAKPAAKRLTAKRAPAKKAPAKKAVARKATAAF